jgi:DNA-binding NtrC family response regulator
VITDIVMPEREGIGFILELRREYPEAKVIAISGGGRIGPESYLPVAERLGAMRTFAKPLDRVGLLQAVQDAPRLLILRLTGPISPADQKVSPDPPLVGAARPDLQGSPGEICLRFWT